MLKRKIGFRSF